MVCLDIAMCNHVFRNTKYLNIPKVHMNLEFKFAETTLLERAKKITYYLQSRNILLKSLEFHSTGYDKATNKEFHKLIMEDDSCGLWRELRQLKSISFEFDQPWSIEDSGYFKVDLNALLTRSPTLVTVTLNCTHCAFTIVPSVTIPSHSLEELSLQIAESMLHQEDLVDWLRACCPKLRTLDCWSCYCSTPTLSSIHAAFPVLEILDILIKREEGLPPSVIERHNLPPKMFSNLRKLELHLDITMLTQQWEDVLDTLERGGSSLESLTLSLEDFSRDNSLQSDCSDVLIRLYAIIATFTSVRELKLQCGSPIRTTSLFAEQFIYSLSSVTYQQLNNLCVSSMSMFHDNHLAAIAKYCTKLESFHLQSLPKITDEGIKCFCAVDHVHLKDLRFYLCDQLTDATFNSILTAPLMDKLAIMTFYASSNSITKIDRLRASRWWRNYVYGLTPTVSTADNFTSNLQSIHIKLPSDVSYTRNILDEYADKSFSVANKVMRNFPNLKRATFYSMIVDRQYYHDLVVRAPTLSYLAVSNNICYSAEISDPEEISFSANTNDEVRKCGNFMIRR